MTPNQIADEIEKLIISVTEKYSEKVKLFQNYLYNQALKIVKNLELDPEGYIKQSASNRKILADAESIIDDILFGESLANTVSGVISVIPKVDKLNISYFQTVDEYFNENRNFIKSIQQRTIESIESNLLSDGLKAQVRNPIVEILNINVNSGGQFSGFLNQLQNFIKGTPEVDGRVLSYSRGFLRDALFQYSRTYQEAITADLGLEFYSYSGGLIDTSRDFCIARAGKVFHRKEIESWAAQNWVGKMRGTTESSIFAYCGGYGCTHSLIPIAKSAVPKVVLAEAKANGYIK